jgi:peptidoglycan/xylan/chitin deacetylase (PgdA/CDA1 family)
MPPPLLILRIEVPTLRAARTATAFADLLRRHRASASFLFSLGPDTSGRALNHIFAPERQGRALRCALPTHYGWGALCYGTLLPAPHIARRCADTLRHLHEAGFEIGVHGWDSRHWVNTIMTASAPSSQHQIELAQQAYTQLLDTPPQLFAAPGWRSNRHALRLTQRLGFSWASDMRGQHPFIPVWNGEIVRCPQIPTTLPTLDELVALDDPSTVTARLLALTANPSPWGHVFSLRLDPALTASPALIESLLTGWREQGYELASIRDLAQRLDMDKLPRHEVVVGTVPGRTGTLLLQGEAFLSAWRQAA